MPIKVNVGLSRKMSQDYNSRGFSLNIEAELPATAINDPSVLAETVNHVFQLADDLLEEQIKNAGANNGHAKKPQRSITPDQESTTTDSSTRTMRKPNGQRSHNGGNGNSPGQLRGITDAQIRAIGNMAKRLDVDADQWAETEYGVPVRNLALKQASAFIDTLKQEFEAFRTEGVSR